MLTTGVRLRGNAEAQRALVPQLEERGVSALGFGVGLGFKRVPPALVEIARAARVPGLRGPVRDAVPGDHPLRRQHAHERRRACFRRLTALQRYLVDALRTPQPERAMVERLARFLDASVVLLDADGAPEIVAGAARRRAAGEVRRAARAGSSCTVGRLARGRDAGRRRGRARPRWLVLASPPARLHRQAGQAGAEAAAPLLAAMARLGDVVRDQEQAVKAALLEEALAPLPARDPLPLAARAAAFGLDFTSPARMVVILPVRESRRPVPE